MILNINFVSYLADSSSFGIVVPAGNKPLSVISQMYNRVFSYLYQVAKNIIGDMERVTRSETITDIDVLAPDVYKVASQSGDWGYITTTTSCSCPDHTYRGRECKHIKALKRNLSEPKVLTPANNQVINLSERLLLEQEAEQARADLGC
jgi:hypothetical protein